MNRIAAMNDSSPNLASQLLKSSAGILPSMAASPEMLGQQLLCMNNILAINPRIAPNTANLPQFSKEQLTEYQLAKMRFNQELLSSNSFYNLPYTYSPYADMAKSGGASLTNVGRGDNSRYRYLHEEPKPQHSYIGLIAMAILSMPEQKMVLSDIYQHILDHYPYFRNRGPGWRNSIRHNLSLNDCFIKAGRSANGKGHYWAIHPANLDDFKKGDFRRRKAQRKVRKHMGLSVPDEEEDDDDSPLSSPTPVADKGALSAGLLAPNPFMQVMSNPLFGASNACFSQQAFNLFNTLRFALPSPHPLNSAANSFNETLYRQLINLNIKQDLHRNGRNPSSRKEFSIESLLSTTGSRPQAAQDLANEADKWTRCKLTKSGLECDAPMPADLSLEEQTSPKDPLIDPAKGPEGEQSNLQPVNLKMN